MAIAIFHTLIPREYNLTLPDSPRCLPLFPQVPQKATLFVLFFSLLQNDAKKIMKIKYGSMYIQYNFEMTLAHCK